MREDDTATVRKIPLFSGMSQDRFDDLMRGAYLQRFPPRVQLITEGEPADFLYVVEEGTVELFATSAQRESVIVVMRPVSAFILAAVLKDAVYLMSARTLEPSRLVMIPAEDVRQAMEEDRALMRAMVLELATAYRTKVKLLKDQKLRPAVERLANYLLREDLAQGGSGHITLPLDKRTVASLLGMTPENLSRAFATLRPYGVKVDGAQVRLTKPDDLRTLAKPTPLIDDFAC